MPTISIKDAVGRAKNTLKDLYEDDPPRALALEEIELMSENDRQLWAVTLGFQRRRDVTVVSNRNPIQEFLGQTPAMEVEHRVYKTVLIDANSGDFVKMDIRQVQ
jgi:hypothetical protein